MGFVYRLEFANGKSYVGLTTKKSVSTRFSEHRSAARDKRSIIYNAWRKHGEPILSTLLEADDRDLANHEKRFILELGTLYPDGYNSTIGGEESLMHSPLVAAKVSATKLGVKRPGLHTAESKALISKAMTGRKVSDEMRIKCSIAKKGKPSALRGRTLTPEHVAKVVAFHLGRPKSDETRAKIAIALTGKKQSPETIAKRIIKIKATWAAKRDAAR